MPPTGMPGSCDKYTYAALGYARPGGLSGGVIQAYAECRLAFCTNAHESNVVCPKIVLELSTNCKVHSSVPFGALTVQLLPVLAVRRNIFARHRALPQWPSQLCHQQLCPTRWQIYSSISSTAFHNLTWSLQLRSWLGMAATGLQCAAFGFREDV